MRKRLLFCFVLNILLNAQGTVAEANIPSTSKFMKVSKARPPIATKCTEMKLPLQNCADKCLEMQTCKSFTYLKQRSNCRLYGIWSGEIRIVHASVRGYYQKAVNETCPINVFYGGKFTNSKFISTLKSKSYIDCLKACRDTTSCYSTNFNVKTTTCYLNPDSSTDSNIRRRSNNWISTKVDRDKFDNDPDVLTDLNGKGCDLKFLYVLHFLDEITFPGTDAMRRRALYTRRRNTSGDIKLKTVTPVGSLFDCAIRCMLSPGCVGFGYELFCQMAVKY
ncbi:uncharacterized protein LOC118766662 isoform X2 [Octopus sinensis]|uniref:Uncharacterized protein LOC118766662 isoform X2 n=1 Tax=Octopus sinensis TaxID=2607531 RepID=A0A7E6FEC3_9MOLL|nr:uncharacterized protein LOC118766662 isoform X2 [Octopus sinensis]